MSTPSDPTRPAGNAPAASGASASATPHKRSQEPFLNDLRKRKLHVEIYLMSGVRLTGTIESFDAQMVLLKSHDVLELVNKQLISTIVPARRPEKGRGGPRRDMGDRGDRPPMKMRRPAPMTGEGGGGGGGGGDGRPSEGPRVSYRSRRTLTRTPGSGGGGGGGGDGGGSGG